MIRWENVYLQMAAAGVSVSSVELPNLDAGHTIAVNPRFETMVVRLKSKIVLVLALGVLTQPQEHCTTHDTSVLYHVGHTIILVSLWQYGYQILDREYRDTSCQTAGHECKTDKQEQPCSPLYTITRESCSATKAKCSTNIGQVLLVDKINHDHTESSTKTWNPISKSNIGSWWFEWNGGIEWRFASNVGNDGCIEEEPPTESEEGTGKVDAKLTFGCLKESGELREWNETDSTRIVGSTWERHVDGSGSAARVKLMGF